MKPALATTLSLDSKHKKTLIEEYRELEEECDRVLKKITEKKLKQANKTK